MIEKFGQSWLNGSRGLERLEIHGLSFWETSTSEPRLLELLPRAEARIIVGRAAAESRTVVFIPAAQEIGMTKPVPARATGYFHERPAPPFLRGTFSCTWIHRMPEASGPPIIVAPDGTIDLQWIDGIFRVAGPDKDPMIEILPAATTLVGFRFQPAAAAAWLAVPANQLLGQRLSLQELWGPTARRLAAKVREHRNIAELTAALENAIADFARKDARIDARMRAAYDLIQAGPPAGVALVPWLGRALAMSERTLRRRFDESFGYGPKTLDRILRYQRFLRLVRLSRGSTAILAAEAGYSDQPHLVRESQRLAGCTPLEVERIMRTVSGRHELSVAGAIQIEPALRN